MTNRSARIVLAMQRVHQDDLAGYLEEQGGFDILNLPAIAPRTASYDLGAGRVYVRQRGELLHPANEPAAVLSELKREMGPIAFSAQYQQSPFCPVARSSSANGSRPMTTIRPISVATT